MIGVFRQKTPSNTVLMLFLGLLLKLPVFFHSSGYILKENDGAIYHQLISTIGNTFNQSVFVYVLIGFLLNMSIATMLNHFLNADRLMTKSNFLAGMAYLVLTSFLPAFNLLSANLIASVFLFAAFISLVNSSNARYDKNIFYNSALLIGTGSLFFPPAIMFIVWCFIALILLKPFRISDWVVLLLGVLTPYYFYAAYLYLTDNFQIPSYLYHLTFWESRVQYSIWHAIALFLLLMPLLAGIYYMQSNAGKMMVNARKGWLLILWYLAVAITIAFFNIGTTSENLVLLLIPVAAFHGYGYLNSELKLYPKIAFWCSVGFVIAAQLFSPLWS